MATTLSDSMSLRAADAASSGLALSFSTMSLIGRPLMPPLSLTQSK